MVRLHHVKKARKGQGVCWTCDRKIKKGDSYYWWKFKRGARHVRCKNHRPDPWDLVSNPKLATIMQAQDTAHRSLEAAVTVEDLKSALESLAETVRDVSSEYQESIDNILEHFPNGNPVSEECEEKISNLDLWADELENHEPEEWDEGAVAKGENVEEAKNDWFDNVRCEAENLSDECPI
jgi:hypothetical protein